ncbi:ABC transporter permease [Jiella mangrovi]|uniref:ABC transporter permease n=1 Tax=Jiella mangrovi TaxID=2821407 RepID=A0ABS4BGX9_9HYPH|nr:ABC transporter permease [Jiella mangrovi]MBP0615802.1 ABC transporter permease [Jiella mangrovi]
MLTRFLLRRILTSAVQMFALTLAVFFLVRLLPADPVSRLVGMNASPEAYAQAQRSLGLDQPVFTQLLNYLGLGSKSGLLQGDLGVSWLTNTPVVQEIGMSLPITLELLTYSFLVTLIVAVPIGVMSAANPGKLVDKAVFIYGLFGGSQPEFWWGLLFVLIFFSTLGVAPAPLGMIDPLMLPPPRVTGFYTLDALIAGDFAAFADILHHLMLPVLTMVFVLSGPVIKMVRQSMIQAHASDFVLYGTAIGLRRGTLTNYALRAAIAPTLTLVGILYGVMLGGAVLVENVFALGGIGQYAVRSVLAFDYPSIQGIVLVITAISLLIYLALDILYALIDPRVVYS